MNVIKKEINNMSIHLIKTKKFKTFIIDVVFQKRITKDEYSKYTFLSYLLSESSKKYPSRKYLAIEKEELYQISYSCHCGRVGNYINISFSIEATNPSFLDDQNYINEIYKFLYEMIMHPNIEGKAFDEKQFDIIKNYMQIDIESIKENARIVAFDNAFNFMDSSSITSSTAFGTMEGLNAITKENIYSLYVDLIKNAHMEVFVIGKYKDSEELLPLSSLKYLEKISNNVPYKKANDLYVINKESDNTRYREDSSSFIQSQLVLIYNTVNLTKKEKEVVLPILNYILGSGGLKSKLYDKVREKNGYCYQIGSSYQKYDNLLLISSALKKENAEHAIKLIRSCVKEMQEGNFTKEDIKDAKKNMVLSLEYTFDNINCILNDYEAKLLNDNYSNKEKLRKLSSVTKDDIIKVAFKLKENINYLLCEGNHEND